MPQTNADRPASAAGPITVRLDDDLAARVESLDGDVDGILQLAVDLGRAAPLPGSGRTADLWSTLATVAAADVTAARVIEPHLDALAILDQAGRGIGRAEATWGVFAAEGAGMRVSVRTGDDGATLLSGVKPWCSLAARLSDALVTAWLPSGGRGLFAISLGDPGVDVRSDSWHAVGLAGVESGPVDLDDVPAEPVGAEGWYLRRPGFAWGGIGVAACWWGGAVGVARALTAAARRREPDQIALHHLGAVHARLTAARLALAEAAAAVDTGQADGDAGVLLELRTRAIVHDAAEDVLRRTAHALGPAPLALDAAHSRRVADLSLYLRQHHAERDQAQLGRRVLDGGLPW